MIFRKWVFRRPPFMPLHVRRVRALAESAGGAINTTPTPVSVTISVVTPTTKKEITPTPVGVTVSVVTPTTTKEITPTPVAATVSVVTPTTTKEITPTPVIVTINAVTPTTTGGSSGGAINTTPTPVSVTVSAVTPTTQKTVTPTPVGVIVSVVTPTTTKTITPSPVVVTLVVPTPTTTGGITVVEIEAGTSVETDDLTLIGRLYQFFDISEVQLSHQSYFQLENTQLPYVSISLVSTVVADMYSCNTRLEESQARFTVYARVLEQLQRILDAIEDRYDRATFRVKNRRLAACLWSGRQEEELEPGIFQGILDFEITTEKEL